MGSVRAQTFGGWRHVVCSDGVEEGVPRRLCSGDDRVEYRVSREAHRDYGPGVRNEVLATVDTEYVCFLDDDNVIMPAYLERMVGAIEAHGAQFAVCACLHYGPLREDIHGPGLPKVLSGVPPRLYYVDTIQVVARSEAVVEVGFARDAENDGYYGDGITYEEMGRRFPYAVVPEVLAVHF